MQINRLQMRLNTRNEIIVYLDYHSKVDDGRGNFILDFRREEDYSNFVNIFAESNIDGLFSGTYLHIIGYSTDKRLMRGCYYSLNIELMRMARMNRITDSYLFIAEFDFRELSSEALIGQELLLSHETLSASQLYYPIHSNLRNIVFQNAWNNLQLHVADVGQANWNELRSNGSTIVQYDMGRS